MQEPNLYEVLGIPKNASNDEIKKAYRNLALQYHPDKSDEKDRVASEEKMKALNAAYKKLIESDSREQYDDEQSLFDFDQTTNTSAHLPVTGIALSENFKTAYSTFKKQFETEPLSFGEVHSFFKKPAAELYQGDWTGEEVFYPDIFSYLAAKSIAFPHTDFLYTFPSTLTPELAIIIFTKFLAGDYDRENCLALRICFLNQLAALSLQPTYSPDMPLYQAILAIVEMTEKSPAGDALILEMSKIVDYALNASEEVKSFLHALFRSKAYRVLFHHALSLLWQSGPDVVNENHLQALNQEPGAKECLKRLFAYTKNSQNDETFDEEVKEALKALMERNKVLYRFEKCFADKEINPSAELYRMQAYMAIDWVATLSGTVGTPGLVHAFMLAGCYFQRASQLELKPSDQMADEKMACMLYENAFIYAKKENLYTDLTIYVGTHILKYLSAFQYQDPSTKQDIHKIQEHILQLTNFYPFFQPHVSNFDFISEPKKIRDHMGAFLESFVNVIEHNKRFSDPIPLDHAYSKILYEAYKACLGSWYPNKASEEKIKLALTAELLNDEGWTLSDVQDNITIPYELIRQDSEGYPHPNLPFNIDPETEMLSSIDGFSYDQNSNFELFVTPLDKNDPNTQPCITLFDFFEIAEKRITAALVSLEPILGKDSIHFPKRYHPFNEMIFGPAALEGTGLLPPLYLTDYILKMLTTGVQPQAQLPYGCKSTDELIQMLPEKIQKAVRQFQNTANSDQGAQRFWISAEETPFLPESGTDGIQRYVLGKPNMVVKTRMMEWDSTGRLVDTQDEREGWPIYVITSEQKKRIMGGSHEIPSPALLLVPEEASAGFSFLEYDRIYEGKTPLSPEAVTQLIQLKRNEAGKIIPEFKHRAFLYKVTKEATRATNRPHAFSPEFIFAYKLTKYYHLLEASMPIFARATALVKAMAVFSLLNDEMNTEMIESTLQDPAYWIRLAEAVESEKQWANAGEYALSGNNPATQGSEFDFLFQQKHRQATSQEQKDMDVDWLSKLKENLGGYINGHSTEVAKYFKGKSLNDALVECRTSIAQQLGKEVFNNIHKHPELQKLYRAIADDIAKDYNEVGEKINTARKEKLKEIFCINTRKQDKKFIENLVNIFRSGSTDQDAPILGALERAHYLAALDTLLENHRKGLQEQLSMKKNLQQSLQNIGFKSSKSQPVDFTKKCQWVPTCLNKNRRVYGGFLASANLVHSDQYDPRYSRYGLLSVTTPSSQTLPTSNTFWLNASSTDHFCTPYAILDKIMEKTGTDSVVFRRPGAALQETYMKLSASPLQLPKIDDYFKLASDNKTQWKHFTGFGGQDDLPPPFIPSVFPSTTNRAFMHGSQYNAPPVVSVVRLNGNNSGPTGIGNNSNNSYSGGNHGNNGNHGTRIPFKTPQDNDADKEGKRATTWQNLLNTLGSGQDVSVRVGFGLSSKTDPNPPVYRGDARAPRAPDYIFNKGFTPWGNDLSISRHSMPPGADDTTHKNSGYVSTSQSKKTAECFPWTHSSADTYLYEIRSKQARRNVLAELSPLFPDRDPVRAPSAFNQVLQEGEQVFTKIYSSEIKGAWKVYRNDPNLLTKVGKQFISNPNYVAPIEEKLWDLVGFAGYASTVVGLTLDGLDLYDEYKKSKASGYYGNTYRKGAEIGGSWVGAYTVGSSFARAGALLCAPFSPLTSVGCAFMAGFFGSIVGGIGAGNIAVKTYDFSISHHNENQASERIPNFYSMPRHRSALFFDLPSNPSDEELKHSPGLDFGSPEYE